MPPKFTDRIFFKFFINFQLYNARRTLYAFYFSLCYFCYDKQFSKHLLAICMKIISIYFLGSESF